MRGRCLDPLLLRAKTRDMVRRSDASAIFCERRTAPKICQAVEDGSRRRVMNKKGGHAAWATCMGMLAMTSCGSGDLTRVEPGSGAPTTSSTGSAARGTRSVAGVQLAEVNVTPTHSVAFWEVR